MDNDDVREIVQLWWVAKKYFKLAETAKEGLLDNDLQTKVGQLADKCKQLSDITGTNEKLMCLNAHLGSCAIKLYSIDENIRGRSKRWNDYKDLEKKNATLTPNEVKQKASSIVHFLLRHNVSHEEDEAKKKKYEGAYKVMQEALQDLKIKELYENMQLVMQAMEPEIEPMISCEMGKNNK